MSGLPASWERLRSRSEVSPSGCRIWTGGRDWDGYGILRVDGASRRAHRVAYALDHGPIPAGMVVMHTCDVPSCIEPRHLRLGTIAENNADRQAKGRSADRRGERCPTARLTADDVRSIRSRLAGGEAGSAIAAAFGVSRRTVSHIAAGNSWSSIT